MIRLVTGCWENVQVSSSALKCKLMAGAVLFSPFTFIIYGEEWERLTVPFSVDHSDRVDYSGQEAELKSLQRCLISEKHLTRRMKVLLINPVKLGLIEHRHACIFRYYQQLISLRKSTSALLPMNLRKSSAGGTKFLLLKEMC
ncbi:hypothetical protein CS542_09755 [Pedobacter sp. IW39]|nr:hypothetical protein CS542_09755 [Pedobacter sp. IW39]